jgi:hypothetical protein
MRLHKVNIPKEELSTQVYLNAAKDRINSEIYDLIDNNWLNGLITKIEKISIKDMDTDMNLHYEIFYEVFEDENFKFLTERLQLGL